jgi:hypothetical protein
MKPKPLDQPTDARTIGALQDEIKQRDRRIEELRGEVDELRDLIRRLEENAEDYANVIERWKEAFQMVESESGGWTWAPFWDEHHAIVAEHNKLVAQWNRYVPLLNLQPVGRPLLASEAQCAQVRRLRKAGHSLRGIADETNLGLNTVRTIVGKANGTDRTTKQRRIEIDRNAAAGRKRQKRTGDALPRQAQRVVEESRALIKEAKGLGRTR